MRNSVNLISKLKVKGEWMRSEEKIRDSIEDHYINLYSKPFSVHPIIGVEVDSRNEEHKCWLQRPFTIEEVEEAHNSILNDKASGSDGFPRKF